MRTPTDAMPPGRASVLLAIVRLHALNGRCTIREVCAATGMRSTSTVAWHLVKLDDEGLIVWTHGQRGTLRPAVQQVAV